MTAATSNTDNLIIPPNPPANTIATSSKSTNHKKQLLLLMKKSSNTNQAVTTGKTNQRMCGKKSTSTNDKNDEMTNYPYHRGQVPKQSLHYCRNY